MTKYSELVTYAESVHMFGVRFLPCGLYCFARLPLHEFANLRLCTSDVSSVFDEAFVERLCEEIHVKGRIRIVEEYLLSYLARNYQPTDAHIASAVTAINHSGGKQPVSSLMDAVCLCQRHFERKFKQYTGFTPKEYSRIIKFKNAINLLRSSTSPNLLTIAVEAGYYDLSHFSKEIKTLSGNTPASFLSLTVPEDTTLTYIES
nr:helix-turn-helix domain-containing protein [uncultured Bacteroides sp.]